MIDNVSNAQRLEPTQKVPRKYYAKAIDIPPILYDRLPWPFLYPVPK